ncbi:hypothetical protein V7S43_012259 [Phytophthora oleae]|uniref:Kinesin motor domain-containing protein n=1 Tax=Phytophthora oleae TaxID=2107226 RepID=A0ABD3F7X8_9STRA
MDASAPAEAESIAVCIRVRPLNERETRADDQPALTCVPALNVVSLTDPETGAPLTGKGNVFQYDQIFDASSDSHAIYERVARRIVRSTLGGINGTIFAYGQTSSGKTYTMQGDGGMPFEREAESARPGILQLAVEDIFQYIESCADRDFLLRVSFLEIYNEVVKDLLNPSEKGANLKLREDPRKGVYVECKEEIITNYEDIVTLLQTGNQNRTVGQTAMNDKSSRSHSVFRIVIESKQKADSRRLSEEDVNGAVLVASLNLVDLAGSESLRHTGAEGIRQREAGNINKSLLTLARVINSLASSGGGQNAPFRDSKLTRLLQTSLGGNTRTLIVCCVTPSDRYIEETKSTLQFAARAKDIQTSATVNEVLDDQTQLRRLKREVHELKKLVNSEALNALKAENEALISEKNHNKTEMARLMGLILTGSSVDKSTVIGKKRKQRGKHMRETWGPGDFPTNIKALGLSSPHLNPLKRRSLAKENLDPQTLFRVYEDIDRNAATEIGFDSSLNKLKPARAESSDNSKSVLDLFSAVFRIYRDENCKDILEAVEAIGNEKLDCVGDIERARALDVLADIRRLMVAEVQSKAALGENLTLRQEVEDLRSNLNHSDSSDKPASCDCSGRISEAFVEELVADLMSAKEKLAEEKKRYQDLETEKTNSQQMAAEELDSLRSQLEALRIVSSESHQRFEREKRQLEATVRALQSGLAPSRARKNGLESLPEETKASQTVLQQAVAERDEEIATLNSQEPEANQVEQQQEAKPSESTANQTKGGDVVEQLAGQLQEIMQELAQLRSNQERTEMEKEELQAETDRISEELDASQRQGYEMSETLVEKEHIAKVLQAQLDAKVMTISQMRTKHSVEVETLQQCIQDLTTEKEQLSVKVQELSATGNTTAGDGDCEQSESTECIDTTEGSDEQQDAEMATQKLRSEVERLTGKLAAVELELAGTKERLEASLTAPQDSSEHSNLKAAFEKLKADFDDLQQEHNKQLEEVPLSEDQTADASDRPLQELYDALTEDFERITGELENVSRERDDCLEELRALESQLMEVSEEKMKLAIAADEQEIRLREVETSASSSLETIAALQVQLEEVESAKATLETSKAELEQNIEKVQSALTSLQAQHVSVDQMNTGIEGDSVNSSTEIKQLQQRLELESKQRERFQLDVQSYEEAMSVLRKDAKDRSARIADLVEKTKMLETDLDGAARTQEQKDKKIANLAEALTRSAEELQEMRLQSKQRLVAAEGKEVALEEKIAALEQQLGVSSTGTSIMSMSMQSDAQTEVVELRERQTELLTQVAALENQLARAQNELQTQDEAWNKKQAMAEKEFARLTADQKHLCEQLSSFQSEVGASQDEMEVQAEELLKAKHSYAGLLEQKEAVQRELEEMTASWKEKQQEVMRQMDSLREQFQESQNELEQVQQNTDNEIRRLHAVIEESSAEIEALKRSAEAREKKSGSLLGEQQEVLQAKCDQLDGENRLLLEKYAALEAQHGEVEERLQYEVRELSQKYSSSQAHQATYQAKLKEMEAQLEATENDVTRLRKEMKSIAESFKSSQMEAVQYHNALVEAQLAKESMDKLVEKQKARIDKLEKVKMTTETLDLFRKLKKDRHDLQLKVQELQHKLDQAVQAVAQTQESHEAKEQRLLERKNEELKVLKEDMDKLTEALRVEKHQAADLKAEMRVALNDEREKAEHEIQEMQALVKEKMQLVEKLESQVASVNDSMAKLQDQKSENVSYLEKENLELHVENRELKKRVEKISSLPKQDELMGDTGAYDASAAAAVKALGEDVASAADESQVNVVVGDAEAMTDTPSKQQETGAVKAGGFLLSTTELDAIAAESQEEPKEGERPECSQQ